MMPGCPVERRIPGWLCQPCSAEILGDFGAILASNVGAGVKGVKGCRGSLFAQLWVTRIMLLFGMATVWLLGCSEALTVRFMQAVRELKGSHI